MGRLTVDSGADEQGGIVVGISIAVVEDGHLQTQRAAPNGLIREPGPATEVDSPVKHLPEREGSGSSMA